MQKASSGSEKAGSALLATFLWAAAALSSSTVSQATAQSCAWAERDGAAAQPRCDMGRKCRQQAQRRREAEERNERGRVPQAPPHQVDSPGGLALLTHNASVRARVHAQRCALHAVQAASGARARAPLPTTKRKLKVTKADDPLSLRPLSPLPSSRPLTCVVPLAHASSASLTASSTFLLRSTGAPEARTTTQRVRDERTAGAGLARTEERRARAAIVSCESGGRR